jgi:hypothetical protein
MDRIMSTFNQFDDFSMAVGETLNMVQHGFVSKIDYQNGATTFSAALKAMPSKDNMTVEYLVGHFGINKIMDKFPCFMYTCKLYYFKNDNTFTTLSAPMDTTNLSTVVDKYERLNQACSKFGHECLLTQFIPGTALRKFYRDQGFVDDELLKVLFIIYQALNELNDTFTHYDLHPDNVIVYKLPDNEVFEYTYDNGCKFKSPYLPKIIDYGRCYIPKLKMVRTALCAIDECRRVRTSGERTPEKERNHRGETTCQLDKGLSWLAGPINEPDEERKYHIDSSRPNRSHDLRLLKSLQIYHNSNNSIARSKNRDIPAFFAKVKFPLTRVKMPDGTSQDMAYSVKETVTHGDRIVNVMDAYRDLLFLVRKHHSAQQYPGHLVHKIRIRSGHPMQYTPP